MDGVTNMLWLSQLKSQEQVVQFLRAQDAITPDKAALVIDSLKAMTELERKAGKYAKLGGICLMVLSIPLLLVIIGFVSLPGGFVVYMIGSKKLRSANEKNELLTAGLSAYLAQGAKS